MRDAFEALFGIDEAMGEVVARTTEPALGAIKLAWWAEALERLDSQPPPHEPRLEQAASVLLPRGLKGAELAELRTGWAALLDEQPDAALVAERGVLLFALAGRLLRSDDPNLAGAGKLYSLAEAARRGERAVLPAAKAAAAGVAGHRFERKLRPLTMLSRLAADDIRRGPPFGPLGTPGRAAAMIAHRITGRVA